MKYYPVNLNIRDRRCLVVGGGSVGTRKIITLLEYGAWVRVIDTIVTETLQNLSENGRISWEQRSYRSSDLDDMFLVISATDNEALNEQIYMDAEKRSILCNIVDRPDACRFILPSIVNSGDLTIAISTSGKSPAFAKHLRKELEKQFGEEYALFLKLMGAIRSRLQNEDYTPEMRKSLFEQLISSELIPLIKDRKKADIDSKLSELLGKVYTFDDLMETE